MRKPRYFSSDALFFFAWAVTPFLILACTTAKTAQNKSTFATDTLIINRTDTVREVQWRLRTDTIRERIYQRDSTSQRQEGNMTIREIWHWETKESDRSRTEVDSLSALVSKLESERRASERQETSREVRTESKEPPWYVKIGIWAIILITLIVIIRYHEKKNARA